MKLQENRSFKQRFMRFERLGDKYVQVLPLHRGFCVEFDANLLLSTAPESGQMYEILYEERPAVIDSAVIAVLNDQADYTSDAIYETRNRNEYYHVSGTSEIEMYQRYLNEVYAASRLIFRPMLATKPKEWSYEEELRLIYQSENDNDNIEFLKYPRDAVKSIIVGERMPDRERKALQSVLENWGKSSCIKRAIRKEGQFKLEIIDWVYKA